VFKLFRACSGCGRWFEQGLDNYMAFGDHAFLYIPSAVLKEEWHCSDCILEKGRQERAAAGN